MPYKGRLVVSLKGPELLEEERIIIAHPMTAGVILFGPNYKNPEQLRKLIGDIQTVAVHADKAEGMPIFADQEGGFVQRFGRGLTQPLPSPYVFGVAYDIDPKSGLQLARYFGAFMAQALMPFGILSLCPVLDLKAGNSVIEGLGRAFHADPTICALLAEAYIDGMASAGMPATGKHFPGHGQDIGDSHTVSPIDHRSLEIIESQDLLPFLTLIKKGKLAAIMPAHITYTEVDPEHTAGMSKIWLEDLLCGKYGFDGIRISDCLAMAGSGSDSYLVKTKKALEHGDIALLCNIKPEEFLVVLEGLAPETYTMSEDTNVRFARWVGGVTQKNRLSLVAEPSVAVLEVTPSPVVFSGVQSASSSAIALGSLPEVHAEHKATDLSAVVIVAENADSVAAAEVKKKEKVKL